jgi:hypothetical protein
MYNNTFFKFSLCHYENCEYKRRYPLQSTHSRSRRYHSNFFDNIDDDRFYEPKRRSRYMKNRRNNFSPEISDEEFFDDRSYIRNDRDRRNYYPSANETENYNRPPSVHGYREKETHSQALSQFPHKTLSNNDEKNKQFQEEPTSRKGISRSTSINEARRRHHVNLKSNIFHNDFEYEKSVEQRKPLSVREFAANHRIGVGLPDI